MISEPIDRVVNRRPRTPGVGRRRASQRWSALSPAPPLTLALFLGPVPAGLAGTWAPAFGILPALGGTALSLEPWRAPLAAPGLGGGGPAVVGLWAGGDAAVVRDRAVVLCGVARHPGFAALRRLLAPLLALPHAAFAIGLAFLIAPSRWLVRLLSPWATGWGRPPTCPPSMIPCGRAGPGTGGEGGSVPAADDRPALNQIRLTARWR